jgi:hypothetical protein
MSTENTDQGNGAPEATLDLEQVKAWETQQGLSVVPHSTFKDLKDGAAAKAVAPIQQQLEATQAELAEIKAAQQAADDEGKSELQKLRDRQEAWKADTAEKQKRLDAATAELATSRQALASYKRNQALAKLLTGSEAKPSVLATPTLLNVLPHEMPDFANFRTDADGKLEYEQATGEVLKEKEAGELFVARWNQITSLHSAQVPGPQTGGAATVPPAEKPVFEQLDRANSTPEQRIAHREAWEKTHGPVAT